MDVLIGDFSVDYNGDTESVDSMDERFTDEQLNELVVLMVERGHIDVKERSEGSIYLSKFKLKFKYRVCVSVGEDWGKDKWEKRRTVLPREGLI